MPDLSPGAPNKEHHPSLLERLSALLMREPDDRPQLLAMLHHAHERDLLDADALSMIEGVLQVSELSAGEIMVPRSQMDVIDIEQSPEQFIPFVLKTAHSRFPVIEGDRDHVIGILLAKDLLRHYAEDDFEVRDMLRPAVFIPESKRLNVLLRDFRANRNHIAIIVDEYGGVAGLVTIEDVLEQIVGDIEDEHDQDKEEDHITATRDGKFRVRALTEIKQFNEEMGTDFQDDDNATIGGFVTDQFGRVPRRGESIEKENIRFYVQSADARQIHTLTVERIPVPVEPEDG
jgi:magnesium and cobalt transporter